MSSPPDAGARYAGCILGVLGLGTVAWNVSEKLSALRETNVRGYLRASLMKWWGACPLRRRKLIAHVNSVTMTSEVGNPTVSIGLPDSAGLAEKVDHLFRELEIARRERADLRNMLRDSKAELSRRIEALDSQASASVENLDAKVRNLAVGGVAWELVGLVWLLVGTVLATVPEII